VIVTEGPGLFVNYNPTTLHSFLLITRTRQTPTNCSRVSLSLFVSTNISFNAYSNHNIKIN